MTKYLVQIEFRYHDAPRSMDGSTCMDKYTTIGVYDTFEQACIDGNKLLETMESKFSLHRYPDGSAATRERFSENGGPFGRKNILVTNMAYLATPFEFYAKITPLSYTPIDKVVEDVLNSVARYREYQLQLNDQ